jgi:hypothetical protein
MITEQPPWFTKLKPHPVYKAKTVCVGNNALVDYLEGKEFHNVLEKPGEPNVTGKVGMLDWYNTRT